MLLHLQAAIRSTDQFSTTINEPNKEFLLNTLWTNPEPQRRGHAELFGAFIHAGVRLEIFSASMWSHLFNTVHVYFL